MGEKKKEDFDAEFDKLLEQGAFGSGDDIGQESEGGFVPEEDDFPESPPMIATSGLAGDAFPTAKGPEPKMNMLEQGLELGKRGIKGIGQSIADNPLEVAGGVAGGVLAAGLAPATGGASLTQTAALVGAGAGTGKLIQENIENVVNMIKGKDVKGTQEVLTEAGISAAINGAFPFLAKGFGGAFKIGAKGLASTAGISKAAQEVILNNPKSVAGFMKDASIEQVQGFAKSVGPVMSNLKDTASFMYEHLIENGLIASKGAVFDVKKPMVKAITESLNKAGFDLSGGTIKPQAGVAMTAAKKEIKKELSILLKLANELETATPRQLYNFQKSVTEVSSTMFRNGQKSVGASVKKAQEAVRALMDKHVPEFRKANSVWSDAMDLEDDAARLVKADNPINMIKNSLAKATRTGDAIKRVMDEVPAFKKVIDSALQASAALESQPILSPRSTGFIPGFGAVGGILGGSGERTGVGTVLGLGAGLAASSPRLSGAALRAAGIGSNIAGEVAKSPGASGAVAGAAATAGTSLQELVKKFMLNRKKK